MAPAPMARPPAAAAGRRSPAAHRADMNAAAAGLPRPVPPPPPPKPPPLPRADGEERSIPPKPPPQPTPPKRTISTMKAICRSSAMEAALKPQVLETLDAIADALQEARQAAGRIGRSRAGHRTSCPPARNAASRSCATRPIDLVKGLKLNNNRIEALVDQMYGINRRLVGLEGRLLRLAEAHGVAREDFLKQYFGNELDPQLGAPRRPSAAAWAGRISSSDERDKINAHPRRDPDAGAGNRASRSPNSAASCRRCRRASANPASPRRK